MTLAPGTKLGPYEISSQIGSGGMGAVYKARDTRLGRDVAIKVSNENYSERFEREARAIAALNHRHICTLYDVGPNYLVMEYVEGAPLKGPLPLDQALKYAAQICDALDAAHKKSILHRDLKPANILVTKAAGVKLLDFGLAKLSRDKHGAGMWDDEKTNMALTGEGQILGTLHYMPPEQLQGQDASPASDIFSFGLVLYETLTGRRAFDGASQASVIAAILERPAPSIADVAPSALDRLLKRCLEKDPENRWQSARDLKAELDWIASAAPETKTSTIVPARLRFGAVGWIAAAVFAIAALGVSLVHFREAPPARESLRFQIPPPAKSAADYLTLSPDGRNLAFVASNGGPNQVWVRAMDTLESKALAGTDGATYPFWSSDGAYLGFFAQGKLKKIAIFGGPAQTLCDAANSRGGSWNRDGVIIFSIGPPNPLFRVSAAGGVPAPVTKLPEGDSIGGHRFPVFLPDGVHFLYDAGSGSGVFLGSLDGAAPVRILPDDANALYAAPSAPGAGGHLLFRREDTLMAQPFDTTQRRLTGDVFPLVEAVQQGGANTDFGAFSVSENGTLVYRSGAETSNRELVWVDRAGKRLGALGKPGAFQALAISPDERTVALRIDSGSQPDGDLWMLDMGRGVLSRFTFRSGNNKFPTWSPDGNRLAFAFSAHTSSDIFQKPADGNGQEELLFHASLDGVPNDWSPDGKWIVFQQTVQKTATDLWLLPLDGDRKPVPYLQTAFNEQNAKFSPDGKWMAYQSNESGVNQVYVQAVPISGAKFLISSSGGTAPRWRRDGKELFYVSADQKLMATPMKLGTTVEPGTPQPLPVPIVNAQLYAPSRDGQRFLVAVSAAGESAATPVTVVTNWQAGLKK